MSNQAAVQSYGNDCPVCGGKGWIVQTKEERLYVEQCTHCKKLSMREMDKHSPTYIPAMDKIYTQRYSQEKTGVPPQYLNAELTDMNFEIYGVDMSRIVKLAKNFIDEYSKWEKAGKGLYIWSETPGSGKTMLSCCIANPIMIQRDLRMRFITAPDYLTSVGESYKREQGTPDKSQVYRRCNLLIFDDIGAQKYGDWQIQEIFRIVNERLNEKRVTIYTSNMPPEKLNIDNRTIDRILKTSVVIQMPEMSVRRKQAQAEQEAFLKTILEEE
jgi:DNA replication protein DnaC